MEVDNNKVVKEQTPRGFASMTPERRTEIARMGGKAAHEKGTAHQLSTVEAIAAGKLRGKASRSEKELAE